MLCESSFHAGTAAPDKSDLGAIWPEIAKRLGGGPLQRCNESQPNPDGPGIKLAESAAPIGAALAE